MSSKKFPISRRDNLVVQQLDGEVLIYDLNDDKAFCLNETSALVWEMCDGKNSISEIGSGLSKKLKSNANDDFIWLTISELNKVDLLENGKDLVNPLDGLSRRDAVKKVGLGTLLALPIVAGVTVPVAAQAASCQIDPCVCQAAVPLNSLNCVSLQCAPAATGCICKNFGGVPNGVANAINCTDLGGGLFACAGRCSR